jgi:hypothetical protein
MVYQEPGSGVIFINMNFETHIIHDRPIAPRKPTTTTAAIVLAYANTLAKI